MARSDRKDPMERLIRRGLKNGIQTLSGRDNRLEMKAEPPKPKVITYHGDREVFLSILQYDAAQLDRSFDQGQRADEFAVLVERIAADLAAESNRT